MASDMSTRTPRPMASDSDVVVLALVTADALEAQGEIQQAAVWLGRAADQARVDGDDERVAELAGAAAALMKSLRASRASALTRATSPPRASSPRASVARTSTARATGTRVSRPQLAAARTTSRRATIPRVSPARAENSLIEALLALMGGAG
jgi:hypothetical protein